MTDPDRQRTGQLGGLTSWAQTENRDARMAPAWDKSPAHEIYHAAKLGLSTDPQSWTDDDRGRISAAKRLYFARIRQQSSIAVKRRKAEALLALADQLEREAAGE